MVENCIPWDRILFPTLPSSPVALSLLVPFFSLYDILPRKVNSCHNEGCKTELSGLKKAEQGMGLCERGMGRGREREEGLLGIRSLNFRPEYTENHPLRPGLRWRENTRRADALGSITINDRSSHLSSSARTRPLWAGMPIRPSQTLAHLPQIVHID
jgi:hypothetical protein